MLVLRLFGSAPYCYQFLTKLFEPVNTFEESSKIVDFIGRAPLGSNFTQNLTDTRTTIKQIRVLVAFILQPEMKLPKIVPDPR